MIIRSLVGILTVTGLTACTSAKIFPEHSMSSKNLIGITGLSNGAERAVMVFDQGSLKREPVAEKESAGTEKLFSRTAGFTIIKPAGWSQVATEHEGESESQIRFTGKDLDQIVRRQASAPLVFMTKHPEPYHGINPGVQVMIRPLGDLSKAPPTDILKMTVSHFPKTFKNFAFVEEIQETRVNGWRAAYTKIQYIITDNHGHQFPTLTRFWMVPRGKYMFTIGMSGAQEGPETSEEEFQRILDSIRIGQEGPRWMA